MSSPLSLLKRLAALESVRRAPDEGCGEGWQSDGLIALWAEVEATIKASESCQHGGLLRCLDCQRRLCDACASHHSCVPK